MMSPVGNSSMTLEESLQQAKKSGAKVPELEPPCEAGMYEYLYDIFNEVAGEKELTYTEIKNYSELTGTKLDALEISTIRQIDRMLSRTRADNARKRTQNRHK